MFDKLLKASDLLSPSVTKLLQKAGLPVGNVYLIISSRINRFYFVIFCRRKRTFKIN
jgi:hypothetical protein